MNPKIIGALRVKNEARWIGRVIHALNRICSRVIVFDDHSTDGTAGCALAAGAVVIPSPFEGFDETRDKNQLLASIYQQEGLTADDWVLMVDGDEELEESACDPILQTIRDSNKLGFDAYALEIVYLWNSEHMRRTDLRTFCRWRPSLFRARCGLSTFVSPYPETGLHCGNIPHGLASAHLEGARLLHFGYMLREDRIRKWRWYNQIDPDNRYEDRYAHMVIGDLPDLPETAVTKWGGPLKLEAL